MRSNPVSGSLTWKTSGRVELKRTAFEKQNQKNYFISISTTIYIICGNIAKHWYRIMRLFFLLQLRVRKEPRCGCSAEGILSYDKLIENMLLLNTWAILGTIEISLNNLGLLRGFKRRKAACLELNWNYGSYFYHSNSAFIDSHAHPDLIDLTT